MTAEIIPFPGRITPARQQADRRSDWPEGRKLLLASQYHADTGFTILHVGSFTPKEAA